jgi:hypothetical protein
MGMSFITLKLVISLIGFESFLKSDLIFSFDLMWVISQSQTKKTP